MNPTNQAPPPTAPTAKPVASAAPAPKTAEPTFKTKIHVKVFSPFKTFYDGQAYSLSAENDTGPFDVLAGHHNFLSLVKPGSIIVRDDKGEQNITITKGLLHVSKDVITLFLDV